MAAAKRAAPREGRPLQKNSSEVFCSTHSNAYQARRRRSPEATIQRAVSVYDGRECVGFIIVRGKTDYEAFNRDERSIGTFKTQREAVGAIPDNGGKKCS
jgi:hypothetical protein